MNSRKIKTSRTFYGKSDISDPLPPLYAPSTRFRPLHRIASLAEKKRRVCGEKSELPQQF
ncbi:hypothetical protein P3T18_006328 [Paraburkholderia sp. GAS199]|uniref:hypothetical protein n=1 Tax=Paraburkholderia sp. GAS199 TaxID=3035126 RepID=UPI003D2252FE